MGYAAEGSLPIGLHYSGPRNWPYLFFAVRQSGLVNVSQDGLTFSANGTIPGGFNGWQMGGFSAERSRFLIGNQQQSGAGVFRVAYTDDGDAWTTINAPAAGLNQAHFVKMVWTPLFGGRWYAQFRQNGGFLGGIWFSADNGLTWSPMLWPGGETGAANLDIMWMALNDERLVCMGRFFADAGFVDRLYYSIDGTNLIAGPVGISGSDQVPNGTCRGALWSSRLGVFVFTGASGSNFFLPPFITTVDGTAVTLGPADMAPASENGDSMDIADTGSLLVTTFFGGGSGICSFQTSPNAGLASWVKIAQIGGITVQSTQIAYSPSLDMTIAACAQPASGFVRNAAIAVPATLAGSWHCVVATR